MRSSLGLQQGGRCIRSSSTLQSRSPPARTRWQSVVRRAASADAAAKLSGDARSHETDVVVIGSGIGGLSCAAMLAKYGYQVSPTSITRMRAACSRLQS